VSEQKNLIESHAEKIQAIKAEVAKVLVGQEEMIHLMIYTLFSKGHILLEGVPGLAKSLAVETFAKVSTARLLARPGTPSSRTCPLEKRV